MTFPTVQSRNNGTTTAGTSVAINLPSGIANGDLCIVFIQVPGNLTITTPSGFTQLYNVLAPLNVGRVACYYKVCDGTEGSTLTVVTSGSAVRAYTAYRITGYTSPPQEAHTSGNGSSGAVIDPPSLTPSGGAQDILWIAEGAVAGSIGSISGTPTNYSNAISGGNPNLTTAERTLNAASEDPSAYTISNTSSWVAATVAVLPAPPSGVKFRAFVMGM